MRSQRSALAQSMAAKLEAYFERAARDVGSNNVDTVLWMFAAATVWSVPTVLLTKLAKLDPEIRASEIDATALCCHFQYAVDTNRTYTATDIVKCVLQWSAGSSDLGGLGGDLTKRELKKLARELTPKVTTEKKPVHAKASPKAMLKAKNGQVVAA